MTAEVNTTQVSKEYNNQAEEQQNRRILSIDWLVAVVVLTVGPNENCWQTQKRPSGTQTFLLLHHLHSMITWPYKTHCLPFISTSFFFPTSHWSLQRTGARESSHSPVGHLIFDGFSFSFPSLMLHWWAAGKSRHSSTDGNSQYRQLIQIIIDINETFVIDE